MKSLFSSIAVLGLFVMVVGVVATAADTSDVTATVTVENVSVSVTDGAIVYGVLPVNTSTSTVALNGGDTQTATNDGNVIADLNIRGADTANWTLQAAIGTDQYKHEFSTNGGSTYTALSTTNQTLANGVAASGGNQAFDLQITTPDATSFFTEQSAVVTVQASAS